MRVGAPSYSIKSLEPLYVAARATDTGDGGDSVVTYHAWRASGDGTLLDDIEAYNVDDCVSTALLHRWLLARVGELDRSAHGEGESDADEAVPDGEASDAELERRERARARAAPRSTRSSAIWWPSPPTGRTRATGTVRPPRASATPGVSSPTCCASTGARPSPSGGRSSSAMNGAPEAFVDDADCLGGCTADPTRWGVPEKSSHLYAFRFPTQETKLRAGAGAVLHDGTGAGTIVELDERAGTLVLKRGGRLGEPPEDLSLMPGGPVPTDALWSARCAPSRATSPSDAARFRTWNRCCAASRRASPGASPARRWSIPRTRRIPRGCSRPPSMRCAGSTVPGCACRVRPGRARPTPLRA